MAYVVLKTGEYEFGSMHIESQLDTYDKNKEVRDHKYFIVRLMPDSGAYVFAENECEPKNVMFEFDNFSEANFFFEGLVCRAKNEDM